MDSTKGTALKLASVFAVAAIVLIVLFKYFVPNPAELLDVSIEPKQETGIIYSINYEYGYCTMKVVNSIAIMETHRMSETKCRAYLAGDEFILPSKETLQTAR